MGSAASGELRDALFAKVQQRAVRVAALRTFRHLHALSLRFHLDRQTGGLARALDRGMVGIQSVLRLAVFNVVPTVIELLLVTGIIWHLFDWRFAAITFAAVASYALFTMTFAGWRARIRRTMNDTDNDASTKALDSLLNFETVKYFGNEPHEAARYDGALARYERAAVRVQVSLNYLNIGQAFIIALGLTLIMLLAAREVGAGAMTVGQFVLVNTYLMQLYQPLGFLGMVYMTIRQGIVDMEQMFRLLDEAQEIADRPGATALAAHLSDGPAGEVRFEDVQFGYRPDREILKGVDFTVPAGGRLAIVGATGAGKSTISRLLFRFYDVTGGRILIDGQDIRDVKQDLSRVQPLASFRRTLCCSTTRSATTSPTVGRRWRSTKSWMPQDWPRCTTSSRAFRRNMTAGGRARAEALGRREAACCDRANPPEGPADSDARRATCALDTETEQDIQAALRTVARDRTTLVIAHRLSTVVEADEILVLRDGRVAERGRHAALLARDGLYARMWALQAEQETEFGTRDRRLRHAQLNS